MEAWDRVRGCSTTGARRQGTRGRALKKGGLSVEWSGWRAVVGVVDNISQVSSVDVADGERVDKTCSQGLGLSGHTRVVVCCTR
jgi:hypothetical protein